MPELTQEMTNAMQTRLPILGEKYRRIAADMDEEMKKTIAAEMVEEMKKMDEVKPKVQ